MKFFICAHVREVSENAFKLFGPFRNATKSRNPWPRLLGIVGHLRDAFCRERSALNRRQSVELAPRKTLSLTLRTVSRCAATTFLRLLIVRSEVERLSWT